MSGGRLGVDKRGAVGWIVFDQPEKRNAINGAMWRGIPEAMARFDADAEVRCVAFRGAVAAREALEGIPGVISVEVEGDEMETRARAECDPSGDPREEIFRMAVDRGFVLRELAFDVASLEDVFARLMRHEESAAAVPGAEATPLEVAEEPPAGGDAA